MSGEFMKVGRGFTMDGKDYKIGDILYITKSREGVRAFLLNRYLYQHNDFIDIRHLKSKDEKLLNLLDNRCWWIYERYLDYLEPCVQSNFLFERIEGAENEKT